MTSWHLEAIYEHLEAVELGQITRLIINGPPRLGKSIPVTEQFPAWKWTRRPSERIIGASYADPLATKLAVDSRNIIMSDWYQANWGRRFQLTGDQNVKHEYANTARGYRIARGTGAGITGYGADPDYLRRPAQSEARRVRRRAPRRDRLLRRHALLAPGRQAARRDHHQRAAPALQGPDRARAQERRELGPPGAAFRGVAPARDPHADLQARDRARGRRRAVARARGQDDPQQGPRRHGHAALQRAVPAVAHGRARQHLQATPLALLEHAARVRRADPVLGHDVQGHGRHRLRLRRHAGAQGRRHLPDRPRERAPGLHRELLGADGHEHQVPADRASSWSRTRPMVRPSSRRSSTRSLASSRSTPRAASSRAPTPRSRPKRPATSTSPIPSAATGSTTSSRSSPPSPRASMTTRSTC
jgi:hypothetical protein